MWICDHFDTRTVFILSGDSDAGAAAWERTVTSVALSVVGQEIVVAVTGELVRTTLSPASRAVAPTTSVKRPGCNMHVSVTLRAFFLAVTCLARCKARFTVVSAWFHEVPRPALRTDAVFATVLAS